MGTNVIVSDRYAVTAAHCIVEIDKAKLTRSVTIRDGTKYEEVIGVRREWVYPWRFVDDSLESAYYDIAVMELERRIIYNYTEYGDTPACIGEKLDLDSQPGILQGFGTQPNETIGTLLEIPLRVLTNEECYKDFLKESDQINTQVKKTLYDGITDQILCSKLTCDENDFTNTSNKKWIKCDAAAGDSGAPLYSIGTFNNETGEKTGETLIGIHSGGRGQSAFGQVLRLAESGKTFLAKWYARVASFAKWIKCTQKNAVGGKLSQKGVQQACDKADIEKTFPPKCEQKIFFETGENAKCKGS